MIINGKTFKLIKKNRDRVYVVASMEAFIQ